METRQRLAVRPAVGQARRRPDPRPRLVRHEGRPRRHDDGAEGPARHRAAASRVRHPGVRNGRGGQRPRHARLRPARLQGRRGHLARDERSARAACVHRTSVVRGGGARQAGRHLEALGSHQRARQRLQAGQGHRGSRRPADQHAHPPALSGQPRRAAVRRRAIRSRPLRERDARPRDPARQHGPAAAGRHRAGQEGLHHLHPARVRSGSVAADTPAQGLVRGPHRGRRRDSRRSPHRLDRGEGLRRGDGREAGVQRADGRRRHAVPHQARRYADGHLRTRRHGADARNQRMAAD